MNPDYTAQLERLITVMSHREVFPTWAVSIISAMVGAFSTLGIGYLNTRKQRKRLERGIYNELLCNYSSVLGMFVKHYEFDRVGPEQRAFEGIFSFDAIENAKSHLDAFTAIPHFPEMRTLYKTFSMMNTVRGGGPHTRGLAQDAIRYFETFLVQGNFSRKLLMKLSKTTVPFIRPRLQALVTGEIKPGERLP